MHAGLNHDVSSERVYLKVFFTLLCSEDVGSVAALVSGFLDFLESFSQRILLIVGSEPLCLFLT